MDPELANEAQTRAHADLPRREAAIPSGSGTSGLRRAAPIETLPAGVVADYAALIGAQGRDVFFRPDRYQLRDLGPVGVSVELESADRTISCELFDVSQNGAAFAWPADLPVEVGTIIGMIVVKFDAYEAYRGEARVSSVRREQGRTIVGASFVDGLTNIEDDRLCDRTANRGARRG